MQIYISGSLAYDRIMRFPGRFGDHILPDKIHILNVCFMVNGLIEKFGGTAGNIAYNLALLGERPTIVACAGRDFEQYGQWLEQQGLPQEGIRLAADVVTASAYITTDQADNQITAFNPGAMGLPTTYDFGGVDPQDALAIISPGNLDDMMNYSRTFKEIGLKYIFDPGQSITSFKGGQLAEMLTGAELLISNDYELELIMGATSLSKLDILERTNGVITTLGEKGSLVLTNAGEAEIPAVPAVVVLDPTGAGDAYRSGLIKGLSQGLGLTESARLGATCASYAVEKHGTQEHSFSRDEFRSRHEGFFVG